MLLNSITYKEKFTLIGTNFIWFGRLQSTILYETLNHIIMESLLNMTLSEIYLDYVNNFATIGIMAEYYEVEYEFMMSLYESARNLYCIVYDPK